MLVTHLKVFLYSDHWLRTRLAPTIYPLHALIHHVILTTDLWAVRSHSNFVDEECKVLEALFA